MQIWFELQFPDFIKEEISIILNIIVNNPVVIKPIISIFIFDMRLHLLICFADHWLETTELTLSNSQFND